MIAGYVSDARPDIAGAVYIAPEGTGLPAASDAALDSRFLELGYISDEGLTHARDDESIRAWGGETALPLGSDMLRFELLEIMNDKAARFVFGSTNVSGVLSSGLALTVNDGEGEIRSLVVDMVLRSDAIRRIVVPRAQVVDVDDIVYEDDEPAGWEVTVKCLPDAEGNYHYEYTQSGVVSPGGIHNLRLSDVLVQSGVHDFTERPAAGYVGIGTVTVKGDANLVPENIRGGVSILGVEGAYQKEAVRLVKRSVTVTQNGTQTVQTPSGYDGIASVSIETDVPTEVVNRTPDAVTPSWQTQTITPGEGYTGLDRVVVRGDGNLRDGRYIAKGHAIFDVEGEYGEEPQTVDVDPAVSLPASVEPDNGYVLVRVNIPKPDTLRPLNIARGVVIFGVTGTLDSDVNNYPSVTVTPGASRQTIDPEAFGAYTGLSRVVVLPVAGLEAENIRIGAEVGGVTGTYRGDLADAVVLPSFDEQLILPAARYTGFGTVTVQGIDTDAVIWSGSQAQYEAMSHASGKLYAVWKEDGAS